MRQQQHYPQRRGGINLFNILGFAFSAILLVGMLSKAGVKLEIPAGTTTTEGTSILKADASMHEAVVENPIRLSEEAVRSTDKPTGYENSPVSSRAKQFGQTVAPEEWVGRFAQEARKQALQKGIPAGITLAVGLSHVQQGAVIEDWKSFIERVVNPLAEIKQNSSREQVQTYFKYAANSERWAEGLGRSGAFSERQLKQIIQDYGLSAFDQNVRSELLTAASTDKQVERKANFVADEVASSVRRKQEAQSRSSQSPELRSNPKTEDTKDLYNEIVGHDVAKKIAQKKLKSGKYLTAEDMERLIEETDAETTQAMKNNLGFMGRKINRNHPEAEKMLDITNPNNSQARTELYQERLKELRKKD